MKKQYLYKIALSFIVFLLGNTIAFSQNGVITGRVKYGKELLSSATVSLGNKTRLTDYKGEFSFSAKPGNYVITITYSGYKKIEQDITIEAGSAKTFEFEMQPNEPLGEIVVLGSRSLIQRSNLITPVPVDAFSSQMLIQTGNPSLTQMLTYTVPSFNASRQLNFEAVTLRGLDPDHLLILVNGIRYHSIAILNTGALPGQLGRGSVNNDLNDIPFSAIEKIEILRDGASAQYGSDAIAGVMNIELKKSMGKTSIQLHTGQFYKGDGAKFSIGINRGISLSQKGFLNFSADYRYQAPTYRGGNYEGTVYENYPSRATHDDSISIKAQDDSIIFVKSFNRKAAISNVGINKVHTFGFAVNGGYRISNRTELYWTAMMNDRTVLYEGAYRFPKDTIWVNTVLYPDGFMNRAHITTYDISGIAGAKGEMKKNWHWELSSTYGNNSTQIWGLNTNNASQYALGKNAQTSFYVGKQIFNQAGSNLNFAKNLAILKTGIKSCNLVLGAEWRFENYQQKAGEEASWKNYDTIQNIRIPGSIGFVGYNPKNSTNKNRNIEGTYIELETEINDHFLFVGGSRYEYYGDFGGNFAGKLAMRYKFSDKFSLRGSVSNGFRAPSLQQRYFGTTANVWVNSGSSRYLANVGIFSNDDPVTKAFGIPPLDPEKSINLSGGFTARIFKYFKTTLDAYLVKIKNRIVLSGNFDRNNPAVKQILDNFPDIQINKVAFFSNAINTRTKGLDFILDGSWNIRKANLSVGLAANVTSTRFFGNIKTSDKLPEDSLNTNTLFNIQERTRLEKGQPNDKVILSLIYRKGRAELTLRNTYFGKTSTTTIFTKPNRTLYESFSPKILTDISLNYSPKVWLKLIVGASNIFNVYPDRLKHYENTSEGIFIYSNDASPFGFNGGYYFGGMNFNF